MSEPNWMTPWLSLFGVSDVEEPLSGDVSQWFRIFSPTVTVNGAGEPALERTIVREVATYGAQLSPLTEIVLALADGKAVPSKAVNELRAIARKVEEKKREYRAGAVGRARKALEKLRELDPVELKLLLKDFETVG